VLKHRHVNDAAGVSKDDLLLSSDIYCPKGRVYATCGYFEMERHERQKQQMNALKDSLNAEQHALAVKYEQVQREMEEDTRLFSLDQIKHMKDSYDLKREIDRVAKELKLAKQREPERGQLRLSRDGKVGLSREGGVCCKVTKGLAVEYHILGRVELACVDKKDPNHNDQDHEEYEDLVHKLHP